MKIQIKGIQELKAQLEYMAAGFPAANYASVSNCADVIIQEARKLIASGYYQPAIDSGQLYNSLKKEIKGRKKNLSALVFSDLFYSKYVQTGTKRMEPRPFLEDALENKMEDLVREFANTYRMVL